MEYKFDMHLHTRYSSDGSMTVDKLFDTALSKGLNGIAVADHNVFEGAYEAISKEHRELMVIPAVEVSTELGHMLCYFVTRGPAEAGLKRYSGFFRFDETAAYVREEGGLIFAAHPYRGSSIKILDVLDCLDGIEIFNGRNTSRRQISNAYARELAIKENLSFVAGSDGHTAAEVGRAYRIFDFEFSPSKADVYTAMKGRSGYYFGSYSPLFLHGFSAIGHSLKHKRWDRLVKDVGKMAVGALHDPISMLRGGTREIVGGKRYEKIGLE